MSSSSAPAPALKRTRARPRAAADDDVDVQVPVPPVQAPVPVPTVTLVVVDRSSAQFTCVLPAAAARKHTNVFEAVTDDGDGGDDDKTVVQLPYNTTMECARIVLEFFAAHGTRPDFHSLFFKSVPMPVRDSDHRFYPFAPECDDVRRTLEERLEPHIGNDAVEVDRKGAMKFALDLLHAACFFNVDPMKRYASFRVATMLVDRTVYHNASEYGLVAPVDDERVYAERLAQLFRPSTSEFSEYVQRIERLVHAKRQQRALDDATASLRARFNDALAGGDDQDQDQDQDQSASGSNSGSGSERDESR